MKTYKIVPVRHSEFGLGWKVCLRFTEHASFWHDDRFFVDVAEAEGYIRKRIADDERASEHLKQPARYFP